MSDTRVPDMDAQPTLSFDELCAAVGLPTRKVRYYIQLGVVDRPEGRPGLRKFWQKRY